MKNVFERKKKGEKGEKREEKKTGGKRSRLEWPLAGAVSADHFPLGNQRTMRSSWQPKNDTLHRPRTTERDWARVAEPLKPQLSWMGRTYSRNIPCPHPAATTTILRTPSISFRRRESLDMCCRNRIPHYSVWLPCWEFIPNVPALSEATRVANRWPSEAPGCWSMTQDQEEEEKEKNNTRADKQRKAKFYG